MHCVPKKNPMHYSYRVQRRGKFGCAAWNVQFASNVLLMRFNRE